jgi:hypothetical protein
LSLRPSHRRGWGSLYNALSHGRIDAQALRRLLADHPRLLGAKRPYMPWTLACGIAAMRRAVPSVATITILPATRPANPS